MDLIKSVTIKIAIFVAFITSFITACHFVCEFYVISQGREQLKQDAYILGSILEEENCLDLSLGANSRYKYFVDNILRSTEGDVFKYDIEVSPTGIVSNNSELGNDDWSGEDNENNPIKVSSCSYVDCVQRGGIVRATLTMDVYCPTLMSAFIGDDEFSKKYNRMHREISQDIEVIGMKYYKGKG